MLTRPEKTPSLFGSPEISLLWELPVTILPFTATLTYVPNPGPVEAFIGAGNPHGHGNTKDSDVPKTAIPEF